MAIIGPPGNAIDAAAPIYATTVFQRPVATREVTIKALKLGSGGGAASPTTGQLWPRGK